MNEVVRAYNMSNPDLMMFASNLANTITQDLSEFENYGVNSDTVEQFRELCDEFENFPPDQYYLADIGIATEDKDEARRELILETRRITNRAIIKWGENSSRYKKFGVFGLSEMTDKNLLATSRLVVLTAESYLSELSDEGLTQDIIDNYRNLTQEFEYKLNAIGEANSVRADKTQERVILGNNLYALVVKYCTIGKSIWFDVDEARYNNYLIYNGGGGGGGFAPAVPTGLRYEYADAMVRWNAVNGATSYQLQWSNNNVDWETLYEEDGTAFNTGDILPDHSYLRIRSRDSNGFSAYSAVLNIVYEYVLVGPANLTHVPAMPGFTWDAVVGAMDYEVELRDASATDEDYIKIYYGDSTDLYYANQPGSFYVRVRSWNNIGTSGWNLLAYIVNP